MILLILSAVRPVHGLPALDCFDNVDLCRLAMFGANWIIQGIICASSCNNGKFGFMCEWDGSKKCYTCVCVL